MAGDALWVAVFALFASRPSGPGFAPPYRSFEGLYVPLLFSVALIVAGLVALHAHLRGTYGGLGRRVSCWRWWGPRCSSSSLAALLSCCQWPAPSASCRIGADGRGRPEGKRAAPLGGAALVVGSLAFFLFDTEGARAWFALPYGGAWVMVGCLLLRSGGAGAAPRPPRLR